jgi:hypothetical protein
MKTSSKVVLGLGLAIAGASAMPAVSHAGKFVTQAVVVSGRSASGSVYSAAKSTNSKEYMGCSIEMLLNDAPDAPIGVCSAGDAAGHTLQCMTANPHALQMIAMINTTSAISFTANGDGSCADFVVDNSSDNTR